MCAFHVEAAVCTAHVVQCAYYVGLTWLVAILLCLHAHA